jgi:hypothetical protein
LILRNAADFKVLFLMMFWRAGVHERAKVEFSGGGLITAFLIAFQELFDEIRASKLPGGAISGHCLQNTNEMNQLCSLSRGVKETCRGDREPFPKTRNKSQE